MFLYKAPYLKSIKNFDNFTEKKFFLCIALGGGNRFRINAKQEKKSLIIVISTNCKLTFKLIYC